MAHAQLSPSAWKRWSTCPGSVALCRDLPDTSSAYADEGTAAHEMAEKILLGKQADLHEDTGLAGCVVSWRTAENGVPFTSEMYGFVRKYTDEIKAIVTLDDGELFVEQRLPISTWTGEEGAHGTADAVILLLDTLLVADLKFGRGIEVDPEDNGQLMIYALAALEKFGGCLDRELAELLEVPWCGDRFKNVTLCIGQPRKALWKEHTISVLELLAFGEEVKVAAAATRSDSPPLNPTPEGCQFCKAKASCPAAAAQVFSTVFGSEDLPDIADLSDLAPPLVQTWDNATLAAKYSLLIFIAQWAGAVEVEAKSRAFAGQELPGFKVVQGRQGNRAWTDAAEAEKMLKSFRLADKDIYDFQLLGPKKIEDLGIAKEGEKPIIGPRNLKKVQELIYRPPGSMNLVPVTDKRNAVVISSGADDLDDLGEYGDDEIAPSATDFDDLAQ